MKKIYLLLFLMVIAAGLILIEGPGMKRIGGEENSNENLLDEGEREDGAREAMKQEALMTRDPKLGYVPTERLLQYKEFMRNHPWLRAGGPGGRATITVGGPGNATVLGGSGGLTWAERGPNNVGG